MLQPPSWERKVDPHAKEIKSFKTLKDALSEKEFPHHESGQSLRQAAERGCYICEPLWRLVNKRGQIRIMSKYNSLRGVTDRGIFLLVILYVIQDDENPKVFLDSWYNVLPLEHPSFSTDTPYNLDVRNRLGQIPQAKYARTAQKWIDDCLMNHNDCLKGTTPKEYPTRLLEIHETSVRLITPEKSGFASCYAALSYCWGRKPFKCLKISGKKNAFTMEEFQQGIPLDNLPIVFQEIISILKSLSFQGSPIRYLWIDAYCIIQDSKEDWARECVRMKDVYQNCDICLAIANAEHPNQSCLRGFTPDSTPPFEAEAYPSLDSPQKCVIISKHYFHDALYDQPLSSRGWPLQERLLSPRVLSLGLGELFWDCKRKQNVCESFPLGPDALGKVFQKADLQRKPLPDEASLEENQKAWAEIVDEYTDRALSFPAQDKLIAISAIASSWQVAMGDTYVAGHFWKSLPISLNWKIRSDYSVLQKPRVPRHRIQTSMSYDDDETMIAPTWSWASIDGPLIFFDNDGLKNEAHRDDILPRDRNTLAKVIDRRVVRVNGNDQQLQTSTTTLALTIETFLIPLVDGNPVFKSEETGMEFQMYIDDPEVDSENRSPCILAGLIIRALLCDTEMEGLVIQRAENGDQEEHMYKRIGHFCIDPLSFQLFGQQEDPKFELYLRTSLEDIFPNSSWKSITLV